MIYANIIFHEKPEQPDEEILSEEASTEPCLVEESSVQEVFSEEITESEIMSENPTTKPNETTTEKPTEPKPSYTLGDIDGNGKITAADARLALRISAKLETGTENQLLAADTDKNGRITASDARKILRVAANLDRF